jgi:hypothetical protein
MTDIIGPYRPGPNGPLLFGLGDVNDIVPINPHSTSYNFFWPAGQYSTASEPEAGVLVPPPSINPPPGSGHLYPKASPYELTPDRRYCRGHVYISDIDVSMKDAVKDAMLRTITPPGIEPRVEGDRFIVDPIPGMVSMPFGVPFVNRLDGSDERTITIACVHTVESMGQYACGPEVERLAKEFLELAFGSPATSDQPSAPAIYDLNLKHNDRSSKSLPDPRNGSSSLAVTKIEGDGRGTVAPAVQVEHPRIRSLLHVCYELYQHIMPASISRFEWDMINWIFQDNNVPGFGGPNTCNTGLQVNVSSDIGDLASMIGQVQGRLHADINDYVGGYTLMILALRLPPGELFLLSFLLLYDLYPLSDV